MRTTLDIPEELLREVAAILKVKTKNEAVRIALSDFIRHRRRQQLLALRGRINIEDRTEELERREIADARHHR